MFHTLGVFVPFFSSDSWSPVYPCIWSILLPLLPSVFWHLVWFCILCTFVSRILRRSAFPHNFNLFMTTRGRGLWNYLHFNAVATYKYNYFGQLETLINQKRLFQFFCLIIFCKFLLRNMLKFARSGYFSCL